MKIIPIVKAESLIPRGYYCYTPVQTPCEDNGGVFKIKCCPYWEHYDIAKHGELPEELAEYRKGYDGAYCNYLKTGDGFKNGTSLLWDQVKECGINNEDYDVWNDV